MPQAIKYECETTSPAQHKWPFDKRFHLLLNIAVGGDWGAARGVDETLTSGTMEVDYVRLYQQ